MLGYALLSEAAEGIPPSAIAMISSGGTGLENKNP